MTDFSLRNKLQRNCKVTNYQRLFAAEILKWLHLKEDQNKRQTGFQGKISNWNQQ